MVQDIMTTSGAARLDGAAEEMKDVSEALLDVSAADAGQDGEELDDDETSELYEHHRFVADKKQKLLRVDKFLLIHLSNTSRNRVQKAADAGFIMANGKPVKRSYKVKPDDVIQVMLDRPHFENKITPEDIPLDIVYEDDDVLVINKPAGMVVHPGHGHFRGTLVNALAHHLGISQGPEGEDERMGVLVHRIDKDTSGLLVVAKNDEAQLNLARQFFVHSIDRRYVAVVWGNLKEDEGTIVGNIGRDPNDRMRFKVFPDGSAGKHAVTHYKVLERFGFVTVVECRLETGRTHQIRVHFNYIGHPLFNDGRYDGSEIRKGTIYAKYRQFIENCFRIMPRQALHAKLLGFVHPSTGKHIVFDSDLPEDMSALIAKWRAYAADMKP